MNTAKTSVALSVLLSFTLSLANLATPFGLSAKTAPLIVVARCERFAGNQPVLKVLELVKGELATMSFSLEKPEQLYRPLESGGLYLLQLDLSRRPWVGALTADSDPERRVQATGCGTVNVMRVVDGFVVGLDSDSTRNGSPRITLDEAKKNLDQLSY
jgi:hypothetical protein